MTPIDPTARRRAELPASIIFTPRELKHYRRWQLQTQSYYDFDSFGHLPSALEYCAFKTWRKDQQRVDAFPDPFRWSEELAAHISPPVTPHSAPPSPPLSEFDFSATATECGHVLHPAATTELSTRCPPCLMDAHLQYMHDLDRKLESVGTPARHPATQDVCNPQQLTYEAWYCGKLDLVQVVYKMEDWLAEEKAWRGRYPVEIEMNKDVRSAQEALMMYWETIDNAIVDAYFHQSMDEISLERKTAKVKRRDSGREKSVGFAKDTCFNEGRAQAYFRKDGPRYDPQGGMIDEDDQEEQDSEMEIEPESYVKQSRPSMASRKNATIAGCQGSLKDTHSFGPEESDCEEEATGRYEAYEDSSEDDCEYQPECDDFVCDEVNDDTSFIIFGD